MASACGTRFRSAACDAIRPRVAAACETRLLRSVSRAGARRRLAAVVTSAAAPQPPPPTNARAARQQLVRSLAQQAVKEAWGGWLGDLVLPLLTDDPGSAPPPRTVPPQQLADPDSKFVQVEGITLHYKEVWPSSSSSSNGSSGSSSGSAGGSTGGSPLAREQQASALPTVLLVHGLNGSTFNWRATMQPLADATGCRCGGQVEPVRATRPWHAACPTPQPARCPFWPTIGLLLWPCSGPGTSPCPGPQRRRVLAFDRPPYGLAERPLSWGAAGQALQFNPYTTEGSARLTLGAPSLTLAVGEAGSLRASMRGWFVLLVSKMAV